MLQHLTQQQNQQVKVTHPRMNAPKYSCIRYPNDWSDTQLLPASVSAMIWSHEQVGCVRETLPTRLKRCRLLLHAHDADVRGKPRKGVMVQHLHHAHDLQQRAAGLMRQPHHRRQLAVELQHAKAPLSAPFPDL